MLNGNVHCVSMRATVECPVSAQLPVFKQHPSKHVLSGSPLRSVEGQQQLLVILRQDTEEVLGLLYQGV